MKKVVKSTLILFAVLMLSLLTACGYSTTIQGREDGKVYQLSSSAYNSFLDANEDRTAFTDAEDAAATYLVDEFRKLGLSADKLAFNVTSDNNTYTSRNVRAVYHTESTTSDSVVIGFNYDNNFARTDFSTGSAAEGAAAASGAGVVLCLAQYLTENSVKLPFNVVFVAFGAGNSDLLGVTERLSYGAIAYVSGDGEGYSGMSVHEVMNTKLMINVDNVVTGDNLYIYAGEGATQSFELFEDCAGGLNLNGNSLHSVPTSRPFASVYGVSGQTSMHRGTLGAHAPFMPKINTAVFFGANLSFSISNLNKEFKNGSSVTLTKNDTRETLAAINPNYQTRIETTAAVIIETLTSEQFLQAHATIPSSTFLDNTLAISLIKLGVLIVCLGAALFFGRYLMSKNRPPLIIVQSVQERKSVFGEDYENPKSENDDDLNDVFKGY